MPVGGLDYGSSKVGTRGCGTMPLQPGGLCLNINPNY